MTLYKKMIKTEKISGKKRLNTSRYQEVFSKRMTENLWKKGEKHQASATGMEIFYPRHFFDS